MTVGKGGKNSGDFSVIHNMLWLYVFLNTIYCVVKDGVLYKCLAHNLMALYPG